MTEQNLLSELRQLDDLASSAHSKFAHTIYYQVAEIGPIEAAFANEVGNEIKKVSKEIKKLKRQLERKSSDIAKPVAPHNGLLT